jgi:uncharacterized protein YgiM (DUF1202 family)
MFRLAFLLGAGLYLTMLVAGQNHGQQRFGLITQPQARAEITPTESPAIEGAASIPSPAAKALAAAFVPARPVMVAPAPASFVAPVVVPSEVTGRVLYIDAKSVNVRSGPGKDFDVVERLKRGEAVLVVAEADSPDGWSLIRIEGDGVEGYVAARLLRE